MDYDVEPAEGGSYNYEYHWIPGPNGIGNTEGNDPRSGHLYNPSTTPITYTLTLEVTDLETNEVITRSVSGSLEGQAEAPSCFKAGTQISMADGTTKNIENVKVGDKVLTYNLKTRSVEEGEVENIVSPVHKNMIVVEFSNGTKTTSTYDHPYYIKNKMWASYDPSMTDRNYKLQVNQMEVGDVAYVYDPNGELDEVRIEHINVIEGSIQTYNLDRVNKNHNFFANGILVHNKYSDYGR